MADLGVDAPSADYGAAGIWQDLPAALRRWPIRLKPLRGWERETAPWRHGLTDFDLWTVARGRGDAWLCGTHIPLTTGTTLMLRPGQRIHVQQHPQDELTVGYAHYDHLTGNKGDQITSSVLPPSLVQLDDPAAAQDPMRTALHLLNRQDDAAQAEAEAIISAVWLDIHAQAARSRGFLPAPIDPRIRAIVSAIRNDPSIRMTLAEAAKRAQLSPDHFSRLFHQETGQSFRDFGVDVRMVRAKILLSETPWSIAYISRQLGYDDYRLFARQFRARHGGRTPTEWRANAG